MKNYLIGLCLISQLNIAQEIPDQFIQQDLKSRSTFYLNQLEKKPEEVLEYGRTIYSQYQLEDIIQKSGLAESPSVLEKLRQAKREIYLNALIKKRIQDEKINIEDVAKERYQARKEQYKTPKKIRLGIIFISKKHWDKQNLAKQQIEKIMAELKAKPDEPFIFQELAKKYSEDKYAPVGGVNFNWIIVPNEESLKGKARVVQEAARLERIGQISPIIEDSRGYTILKLIDVQNPKPIPFDEIRDQLLEEVRKEVYEIKYSEIMKHLLPGENWEPDEEQLLQLIKAEAERRQAAPKAAAPVPADRP